MKLLEVAGNYTVIKADDKQVLFRGDRFTCIKFIKGFDKASPAYVDLRLLNSSGREEQYH